MQRAPLRKSRPKESLILYEALAYMLVQCFASVVAGLEIVNWLVIKKAFSGNLGFQNLAFL